MDQDKKIIFIGKPYGDDLALLDYLAHRVPKIIPESMNGAVRIKTALSLPEYAGVLLRGLNVPILGDPRTFDVTEEDSKANHSDALSVIRYAKSKGFPALVDTDIIEHIALAKRAGAETICFYDSFERFIDTYRKLFVK